MAGSGVLNAADFGVEPRAARPKASTTTLTDPAFRVALLSLPRSCGWDDYEGSLPEKHDWVRALAAAPGVACAYRADNEARLLFCGGAALVLLPLTPSCALAWSGIDEDGNSVEIRSGELIVRGRNIDVFNYGTGETQTYSVKSIRRRGESIEIELFRESGETITLVMDDD